MNIDRLVKIIIHSIFWVVFCLFSILESLMPRDGEWPSLNQLPTYIYINFCWAAAIFYLAYFYLIRFFERRQLIRYFWLCVCFSVVLSVVFLLILKWIYPSFDLFDYRFSLIPIAGTFIIAQCGILIHGFENWFTNIRLKSEIENKHLRNELELLKSQINPHFLFNTLNNIDSLIIKSPKDASTALITLSDMLRFMIYDAKNDLVPLNQELDYLKQYVSLQQLRYESPDHVRITVLGDTEGKRIAPMLLLPFVENAFKHALNTETKPVIDIRLELSKSGLTFVCENRYDASPIPTGASDSGFGLDNVRRRLELLYPKQHSLYISHVSDTFTVELNLQWNLAKTQHDGNGMHPN
jgi:two-component system, LytTR family, sensor kinase